MNPRIRAWLTFACFVTLVVSLIALASSTMDYYIRITVWILVATGSALLIVKNLRRPHGMRGFYFGQLPLLPRNWQRWVLGEENRRRR